MGLDRELFAAAGVDPGKAVPRGRDAVVGRCCDEAWRCHRRYVQRWRASLDLRRVRAGEEQVGTGDTGADLGVEADYGIDHAYECRQFREHVSLVQGLVKVPRMADRKIGGEMAAC